MSSVRICATVEVATNLSLANLRCVPTLRKALGDVSLLRGYTAPIGVAESKTATTAHLPAELQSSLPTIEELEAELADEHGEGT
jgi:hypothetical protein